MKRMAYRLAGIAIALISSAALLAGCSGDPAVAEVDGQKILKSEFDSAFNSYKKQMEANAGPEVWDQEVDGRKAIDIARENVLETLIESRLVEKEAKNIGVAVSDATLAKEMENTKGYFKTDEEFNAFLKEQGITLEYLTDMIKKDLLFTSFYDRINDETAVTDLEVEAYYKANPTQFDEVTASHILVATEEEAKAVKARLEKGEKFEALAKELTFDPSGKENGGSLGSFSHGAMVEPFDKAVFALKAGEISAPVKTEFGWHVIRSEKQVHQTLEQAAAAIKSQLLSEKQEKVYNATMDKLKEASSIKKYTENLK